MGAARSAHRVENPDVPAHRFWNGVEWTEPDGDEPSGPPFVPVPRAPGRHALPVPLPEAPGVRVLSGAPDGSGGFLDRPEPPVLPRRLARGPNRLASHRAPRRAYRRAVGRAATAVGLLAIGTVAAVGVAAAVGEVGAVGAAGWPFPWP